jgi:hypothetical protein
MSDTIITEMCTKVYNETYGALPIADDNDDSLMTVEQGIDVAQVAYDATEAVVAPLLAENEKLKAEIAALKLAAEPVAVPVPVPVPAQAIVPDRSLNAWNVFQRLFSIDFPDSVEAVNSVYQKKYPTKEAKAAYFKDNVARAMALDAKKGKKTPVVAAPIIVAPVVAKKAPTGYNVFYGAMKLGQKGQFGKSNIEIAQLWKTVPEAEKQNWKEMAPTWKMMSAEQQEQWSARAKAMRVAKA